MSAIQNLQEPWNGHTNQEVEDFLKTKIQVVKFTNEAGLLTSPRDESGNSISSETMLEMALRGPIFAKAMINDDEYTGMMYYDSYYHRLYLRTVNTDFFYSIASDCCGGGCCGGGCC